MKFWETRSYHSSFSFKNLRKYWDVYSVTSIISILGWLEFVNKDVLQKACDNWTALHEDIENTYKHWKFILGNSLNRLWWMKFYTAIWNKWKVIDLEKKMITKQAGWTADGVFDIDWETVMVDWKTTASSVTHDMLEKYALQIAQYSSMYTELHWEIDRAIIVAMNRNWWYKLHHFNKDDLRKYKEKFNRVYKQFKEYESKNKY